MSTPTTSSGVESSYIMYQKLRLHQLRSCFAVAHIELTRACKLYNDPRQHFKYDISAADAESAHGAAS